MKTFKQFYTEAYVEVGPNVVRWIDDDVAPEADELRAYVFQIAVWSGTEKRYNLSKKMEFVIANNLVQACRLSRYFERVKDDFEHLIELDFENVSLRIDKYGTLDAMCSTEQGIRDMLSTPASNSSSPILNFYVKPLNAAMSAHLAPLIMGFNPAEVDLVHLKF